MTQGPWFADPAINSSRHITTAANKDNFLTVPSDDGENRTHTSVYLIHAFYRGWPANNIPLGDKNSTEYNTKEYRIFLTLSYKLNFKGR